MLPRFDPTNPLACMSVLEDVTCNAKQIQDSVLEAILSRNAQTEYLKGFLSGQIDKQSFKKNLPLVTYEDYRSYIDRIADGESSNLICDRPISLFLARYLKKNTPCFTLKNTPCFDLETHGDNVFLLCDN